jgi:hypothetical protein
MHRNRIGAPPGASAMQGGGGMEARAGKGIAPMAEGAMGRARRQYRKWRLMSDAEVESLAKAEMNGALSDLGGLRKRDAGLAKEVERRGLCRALGLRVRKFRSWMGMGDDQIVAIVNAFVLENRVPSMRKLWELDAGMADRVRARGLWKRLGFCDGQGAKARAQAWRRPGAETRAGSGKAEADERKEEAPASEPLSKEDILFLAQSAIDDAGLSSAEELAVLDPELFEAAKAAGADGMLSYVKTERGRAPGAGGAGSGSMDGEGAQKRAAAMDEEMMYRTICTECFRMGTGSPYICGFRTTVQKLQSNMHRKLGGPRHRMFRKCWDRMVAEGAITYNSNATAASINPSAEVRDTALRNALHWARKEQSRFSGPG